MKHTPGPVETLARLAIQSNRYSDDKEFAEAVDAVLGVPIYAAAPDLLEALEALVDEHCAPKYGTAEKRMADWDRARAAIAKAKGEA